LTMMALEVRGRNGNGARGDEGQKIILEAGSLQTPPILFYVPASHVPALGTCTYLER
jgi:hypothetical protein